MSEFLIDELGQKIWYDLRLDKLKTNKNIDYFVDYQNQLIFWIRPHNEDGPAIVAIDGFCYWRIMGIDYSFEKWCKKLNKSPEEINFLRLKFGC